MPLSQPASLPAPLFPRGSPAVTELLRELFVSLLFTVSTAFRLQLWKACLFVQVNPWPWMWFCEDLRPLRHPEVLGSSFWIVLRCRPVTGRRRDLLAFPAVASVLLTWAVLQQSTEWACLSVPPSLPSHTTWLHTTDFWGTQPSGKVHQI